jgi:hypothetical protein
MEVSNIGQRLCGEAANHSLYDAVRVSRMESGAPFHSSHMQQLYFRRQRTVQLAHPTI